MPHLAALPLLFVLLSGTALASGSHTVDQINKQFSISKLTIKAGDTVVFKNSDKVQHNVFSLSDVQSFDLGSYPQGESRSVVFGKPGIVDIECSIHPDMVMTIEVKP